MTASFPTLGLTALMQSTAPRTPETVHNLVQDRSTLQMSWWPPLFSASVIHSIILKNWGPPTPRTYAPWYAAINSHMHGRQSSQAPDCKTSILDPLHDTTPRAGRRMKHNLASSSIMKNWGVAHRQERINHAKDRTAVIREETREQTPHIPPPNRPQRSDAHAD